MGKYREFILVVHMSVCLSNLFRSIAYEVGNHGVIGSEVDKHGNERMTEVMDTDAFHACHCKKKLLAAGLTKSEIFLLLLKIKQISDNKV